MKRQLLGEMLVEAGIITAAELKVALEAQRQVPAPLGVTLVALGLATAEQILPILAHQLNRIDVVLDTRKKDVKEPTSVTDAVQKIIGQTVEYEGTDLHLEPAAAGAKVRMRIDGILHEVGTPQILNTEYPSVVARVKVMCSLDIAEKRMPQDGRTTVKVGNKDLDLRVSILPSQYGESVVVRFLQTNLSLGLSNLGLEPNSLNILTKLLERRSGMILVTGPTGCGKTSTLYAFLSRLNDNTKKIVTIEDPVEYILPGAIQMQVNPQIDLTFGRLLRTVLRHDPDVIMVGEIRDTETAEVAIRMALTGHLVLSTVHTNDAAATITRLLEMGIEPFLVASSLSCAIAQRLIRTICPKCRGKRCLYCMGIGLRGRTGIFEYLVIDDEIRKMILKCASAEEIREKARGHGMRSLYEDGMNKVKSGITTQEELDRAIQVDEL